jgi:hypothetical protein
MHWTTVRDRAGRSLAAALLLALVCWPAAGRAQSPGWDTLARWADRYPSDRIAGTDFWNHPALASAIARLLGAERYRFFRQMDVEAPVRVMDGFVSAWRCQPHNCPNQAGLLVDLRSGAVVVCFTRMPDGRSGDKPGESRREAYINSTLSAAPSRPDPAESFECPTAQEQRDVAAVRTALARYVPALRAPGAGK